MAGAYKKPSKKQEARPPFFEGFASKEEFVDARRRLERLLTILDRWDREKKVNLDLEEPSRN